MCRSVALSNDYSYEGGFDPVMPYPTSELIDRKPFL
jgi:hypothetical protein